MRTLFVDATRGFQARAFADALVALGAPAAPPLDLPADPLAGALVRPGDVNALLARAAMGEPARRLAADAMGRLLLAEAMRVPEARRLDVALEASALGAFAHAAAGLAALGVERVVASRIGVPDPTPPTVAELLGEWSEMLDLGRGATDAPGAALLRALLDLPDVGRAEPKWAGPVARAPGVALGQER